MNFFKKKQPLPDKENTAQAEAVNEVHASSPSFDAAAIIRNNLYKRMEPSEALRRLAARFPGGSAKSEVERRRRQVTDQSGADDELVNVITEIANELAGKS